jgi:hypothetical protein
MQLKWKDRPSVMKRTEQPTIAPEDTNNCTKYMDAPKMSVFNVKPQYNVSFSRNDLLSFAPRANNVTNS